MRSAYYEGADVKLDAIASSLSLLVIVSAVLVVVFMALVVVVVVVVVLVLGIPTMRVNVREVREPEKFKAVR